MAASTAERVLLGRSFPLFELPSPTELATALGAATALVADGDAVDVASSLSSDTSTSSMFLAPLASPPTSTRRPRSRRSMTLSDELVRSMSVAGVPRTPTALAGISEDRANPVTGIRWHAFLSHAQATGGNQVLVLREALYAFACFGSTRVSLWYDQDEEASFTGMEEGVRGSAVFCLFLSRLVLERPAVQHEVKTALLAHKPFVFVREADPAYGGSTWEELLEAGRRHSSDATNVHDGKVHLSLTQLDELDALYQASLAPGADGAPGGVVFQRGTAFFDHTVPALVRALHGTPVDSPTAPDVASASTAITSSITATSVGVVVASSGTGSATVVAPTSFTGSAWGGPPGSGGGFSTPIKPTATTAAAPAAGASAPPPPPPSTTAASAPPPPPAASVPAAPPAAAKLYNPLISALPTATHATASATASLPRAVHGRAIAADELAPDSVGAPASTATKPTMLLPADAAAAAAGADAAARKRPSLLGRVFSPAVGDEARGKRKRTYRLPDVLPDGPIGPQSHYRLRRPALQNASSSDAMIVYGPTGADQALFVQCALAHMCSRRAITLVDLTNFELPRDPAAAAASADAGVGAGAGSAPAAASPPRVRHDLAAVIEAAAHTGVVILVLTDGIWDCEAAVAAARTALKLPGPNRFALVHDSDTGHGGVLFKELYDVTPAEVRDLYKLQIAEVLQRKRALRLPFLEWLLHKVGAVRNDDIGGSCAPPQLPLNYQAEPVRDRLDLLRSVVLTASNPLRVRSAVSGGGSGSAAAEERLARAIAVAAGGDGGMGKTTIATALARDPAVLAAFDDVYWVTLGQASSEQLLSKMRGLVSELAHGSGSEPKPACKADIDVVMRQMKLIAAAPALASPPPTPTASRMNSALAATPAGSIALALFGGLTPSPSLPVTRVGSIDASSAATATASMDAMTASTKSTSAAGDDGAHPSEVTETISTVHAAIKELRAQLERRRCLIVVDDAWESAHVLPFLCALRPNEPTFRSAVLFTTRKLDMVAAMAAQQRLKAYDAEVLLRAAAAAAGSGPASPSLRAPSAGAGALPDASLLGSLRRTTSSLFAGELAAAKHGLVDVAATVSLSALSEANALNMFAQVAGLERSRPLHDLPIDTVFRAVGRSSLSLVIVGSCARKLLEPLDVAQASDEREAIELLSRELGAASSSATAASAAFALASPVRASADAAPLRTATGMTAAPPTFRPGMAGGGGALAAAMASPSSPLATPPPPRPGADPSRSGADYEPIFCAIAMALRAQFSHADRLAFCALGLFEDDVAVPLPVVAVLWRMRNDAARTLLLQMQSAGLVKLEDKIVSAHVAASTGAGITVSAGALLGGAATGAATVAVDDTVLLHDLSHEYALRQCHTAAGAMRQLQDNMLVRFAARFGIATTIATVPAPAPAPGAATAFATAAAPAPMGAWSWLGLAPASAPTHAAAPATAPGRSVTAAASHSTSALPASRGAGDAAPGLAAIGRTASSGAAPNRKTELAMDRMLFSVRNMTPLSASLTTLPSAAPSLAITAAGTPPPAPAAVKWVCREWWSLDDYRDELVEWLRDRRSDGRRDGDAAASVEPGATPISPPRNSLPKPRVTEPAASHAAAAARDFIAAKQSGMRSLAAAAEAVRAELGVVTAVRDYMVSHLLHHLCADDDAAVADGPAAAAAAAAESQQPQEALSLMMQLPWLQFVMRHRGCLELLSDLREHILPRLAAVDAAVAVASPVAVAAPTAPVQLNPHRLLYQVVRLAASALAGPDGWRYLPAQLLGRIGDLGDRCPPLKPLLDACRGWRARDFAWLQPLTASLPGPDTALECAVDLEGSAAHSLVPLDNDLVVALLKDRAGGGGSGGFICGVYDVSNGTRIAETVSVPEGQTIHSIVRLGLKDSRFAYTTASPSISRVQPDVRSLYVWDVDTSMETRVAELPASIVTLAAHKEVRGSGSSGGEREITTLAVVTSKDNICWFRESTARVEATSSASGVIAAPSTATWVADGVWERPGLTRSTKKPLLCGLDSTKFALGLSDGVYLVRSGAPSLSLAFAMQPGLAPQAMATTEDGTLVGCAVGRSSCQVFAWRALDASTAAIAAATGLVASGDVRGGDGSAWVELPATERISLQPLGPDLVAVGLSDGTVVLVRVSTIPVLALRIVAQFLHDSTVPEEGRDLPLLAHLPPISLHDRVYGHTPTPPVTAAPLTSPASGGRPAPPTSTSSPPLDVVSLTGSLRTSVTARVLRPSPLSTSLDATTAIPSARASLSSVRLPPHRLVTCCRDVVRVWDVTAILVAAAASRSGGRTTGRIDDPRPLSTYRSSGGEFTCAVVMPSSEGHDVVVTAGENAPLCVWNPATLKRDPEAAHHAAAGAGSAAGDAGASTAAGGDASIDGIALFAEHQHATTVSGVAGLQMWSAVTGRPSKLTLPPAEHVQPPALRRIVTFSPHLVAASPINPLPASSGTPHPELQLWHVGSRSLVAHLRYDVPTSAPSSCVQLIAHAASGTLAALVETPSTESATLYVSRQTPPPHRDFTHSHDRIALRRLCTVPVRFGCKAVAFTPAGQLVIVPPRAASSAAASPVGGISPLAHATWGYSAPAPISSDDPAVLHLMQLPDRLADDGAAAPALTKPAAVLQLPTNTTWHARAVSSLRIAAFRNDSSAPAAASDCVVAALLRDGRVALWLVGTAAAATPTVPPTIACEGLALHERAFIGANEAATPHVVVASSNSITLLGAIGDGSHVLGCTMQAHSKPLCCLTTSVPGYAFTGATDGTVHGWFTHGRATAQWAMRVGAAAAVAALTSSGDGAGERPRHLGESRHLRAFSGRSAATPRGMSRATSRHDAGGGGRGGDADMTDDDAGHMDAAFYAGDDVVCVDAAVMRVEHGTPGRAVAAVGCAKGGVHFLAIAPPR